MTAPAPELPKPTTGVPAPPPREPATHKGQTGRVAVVAGSRGMSGAAVLSALGALRGGAGLVRVYCPESILPVVAASEPCLMTVPLDEDLDGRIGSETALEQLDADWATALAIGPGLGQSPGLRRFIVHVLGTAECPVVLDADGLNNIAGQPDEVRKVRAGRATIFTPHPGEMARLRAGLGLSKEAGGDDDARLRSAHEIAGALGITVVLKGHRTVVCTADQAYINTTGNPGMATGGMGDVLTGMIAALLGQGLAPFEAACLGVHVHGLAADFCAKDIGPVGYLARDVADNLPAALAQASRPRVGFR